MNNELMGSEEATRDDVIDRAIGKSNRSTPGGVGELE